ncbi:MAG TPA: bifunctional oligoribonuclease/PAP phosphatase NrnA [Actinomycetota bacterium]|nr:bifunctional oligoribonuclease/PAP phosphatase NrnA [Actinomycetota bacterium]
MTQPLPPQPEVAGSLDRAAEVISSADRVNIACHVHPDGDALGSALALALALRGRAEVAVGWGSEDVAVPSLYSYLSGLDQIVPPSSFPESRLCVALDCGSPERLGLLQAPFTSAPELINIDHHVSNTCFGTIDVVDAEASSTSELVCHLLLRLGADITPEVATCLYTGLVTDTGRFAYASVGPRTHAMAGFLIDRGVRVDEVSQAVFESQPFGYLKVLGHVLERARMLADPPAVVSWVTQADVEAEGISFDETDELIDVLRSIREADVAAVLKELEDGRWKASLRSKGGTDVSAVAVAFGGGGHRLAAGFTSDLDLEGTIAAVHEALRSPPA